jgi:predicted nucleic acid-binding protein
VAQHFIKDQYTTNADALFERLGNDIELFTADICMGECTNVLWKQMVHFGNVTSAEAALLVDDLLSLPLNIWSHQPLLKDALQIAISNRIAVYDAVYITLAQKLAHPLITADARQEKAARSLGVAIKSITDFT